MNGKYLKLSIYNKLGKTVGIKYLKLENLEYNKEKKFMVNITENRINSYSVDIVEDNEETQEGINYSNSLFGSKFTEDAIPAYKVMALYFLSIFI